MKKAFLMITAAAAMMAGTAQAAVFEPFIQGAVSEKSTINGHGVDFGKELGLKAKVGGGFGLRVTSGKGSASWDEVTVTPSSYTAETAGTHSTYTAETAGAPSEYVPETAGTPSSYVPGRPSKYTPERFKELGNSGVGKMECSSKYTRETEGTYTPETAGTPSSYVPEQPGTPSAYTEETAGTPSSYTPESVTKVHRTHSVELYQAMVTYDVALFDGVSLTLGAGENFAKVDGESGNGFTAMAGLNLERSIGNVFSLTAGAAYNYNADIPSIGLNLGSRVTASAGLAVAL
ncbi:MAG: hypothetical protein HGB02_08510 [Chlorobiaceae bacterium]|nr:hypothetical protein [Chlorobiaceae bacterium]